MPTTPQAIQDLETAMEALSIERGYPSRAVFAEQINTQTARLTQDFREEAKKKMIHPIMRIVDELDNPNYPEAGPSRPQAYAQIFEDVARLFRELGEAVVGQQTVMMGLLDDLEGQPPDTIAWMAAREGTKDHSSAAKASAKMLVTKLSEVDTWKKLAGHNHMSLVQESMVLSNMMDAFAAAADMAKQVFERELDRSYMAITILSGHRETLDVTRAAIRSAAGINKETV